MMKCDTRSRSYTVSAINAEEVELWLRLRKGVPVRPLFNGLMIGSDSVHSGEGECQPGLALEKSSLTEFRECLL